MPKHIVRLFLPLTMVMLLTVFVGLPNTDSHAQNAEAAEEPVASPLEKRLKPRQVRRQTTNKMRMLRSENLQTRPKETLPKMPKPMTRPTKRPQRMAAQRTRMKRKKPHRGTKRRRLRRPMRSSR